MAEGSGVSPATSFPPPRPAAGGPREYHTKKEKTIRQNAYKKQDKGCFIQKAYP